MSILAFLSLHHAAFPCHKTPFLHVLLLLLLFVLLLRQQLYLSLSSFFTVCCAFFLVCYNHRASFCSLVFSPPSSQPPSSYVIQLPLSFSLSTIILTLCTVSVSVSHHATPFSLSIPFPLSNFIHFPPTKTVSCALSFSLPLPHI